MLIEQSSAENIANSLEKMIFDSTFADGDRLDEVRLANMRCQAACDRQDPDLYYFENERFHATIYRESGNSFLEQEALKLQKRLRPFRRQQLRFRGRMKQ